MVGSPPACAWGCGARGRDSAPDEPVGSNSLDTLAASDAAPFDHADFRCGFEAGSSQLPPSPPSWLMFKERRPAIQTLRGWAISVLQEAGAIRECEQHAWMQDRAEPHARERAFDIARRDPPAGVSGGSRRRGPRRAGLDQRCLPRMPPESCDPEAA